MDNIIFGIITVIICTIGYLFAFKLHKEDRYKTAVLLLVFLGLILRVYTSMDFYLHDWDEKYHALVAKNLMQHPLKPTLYDNPLLPYDYRSWVGNHVWLHKQPLALWAMAGSMQIFGVNEIALRLPSILLSTIGIWLTFSLGAYFFNKKVAFLAAFFYSINGLIIELTAGRVATDHIDIFFLFFIEIAIFFSMLFARDKKLIYNVLAGICLGAAILSKWLPALIVLPIWLLIIYDSGKFTIKSLVIQFTILCTLAIAVFLPWQIYIHSVFPLEAGWESTYNFKHLTEVIEERSGPFYYFADKIRINYGELIYLPLGWFFWKLYKSPYDKRAWALSLWFLVPLIFFSAVATKMQGYMLFTAPALFMITAAFYYTLHDHINKTKYKWAIIIVLILLIGLPARYTIERMKPFDERDRHPEWVAKLKELNKEDLSNVVLLNYKYPIEAMFYTDLTAYPVLPDQEKIKDLIHNGYQVIINDDNNIPEYIYSMDGLVIIKLTP